MSDLPPEVTGIDPRLPADLAAALNAAKHLATEAKALETCGELGAVGTAGFDESLFNRVRQRFGTMANLRERIALVAADLVPVADPTALFGASCAHRAAVAWYENVITDLSVCGNNFAQWCDFRVVRTDRPNLGALFVACEREAYAAFAARGKPSRTRPAERDWFGDAVRLFDSPSEADRDEALTQATGIWIGYALFGEAIECLTDASPDERHKLRSDLNYAHSRAVEYLVIEAERAGLNGGALADERRVCQEIFAPVRGHGPVQSPFGVTWFHHPKRTYDTWPECLGEWRYALPPAMQEAIRRGEAAFTRLIARWSITPVLSPNVPRVNERGEIDAPPGRPPSEPVPRYVTLDQMAALVNRSKRTLEKLRARRSNALPDPDVPGGGGRPSEWSWERVRPWLEGEFGRVLPTTFPG